MPVARKLSHKHFRLDLLKIKRAQRLVRAKTETETIDRALDVLIAECERDRLTLDANNRFVNSGVKIRDVYGVLEK